jgi:hypothetical protein
MGQAEMVDAGALQYSNQSRLLALAKETASELQGLHARAWKTQVTTLITYAAMSGRVAVLPEIGCGEYVSPLPYTSVAQLMFTPLNPSLPAHFLKRSLKSPSTSLIGRVCFRRIKEVHAFCN